MRSQLYSFRGYQTILIPISDKLTTVEIKAVAPIRARQQLYNLIQATGGRGFFRDSLLRFLSITLTAFEQSLKYGDFSKI